MFGRMLRDFRERRSLTLRQVGEKAGMDYIILNKIELGLRLPPPLEGIMTLADVLGLDDLEFEAWLDEAAQNNGSAGSRFTQDELDRIKSSKAAGLFFTRRVQKPED